MALIWDRSKKEAPLKILPLEGEGREGVFGVRIYPETPNPLTPALSPPGRGGYRITKR
jgi:hypothetical protein